MGILTEEAWNQLFGFRNEIYTYDAFIYAAARYPAFCNSRADEGEETLTYDEACQRELAAILSHMIEDTNSQKRLEAPSFGTGLANVLDQECDRGNSDFLERRQDCVQVNPSLSLFVPNDDQKEFFGRGAMNLKGNINYGRFSKAYYSWRPDGQHVLLDNPELISQIGQPGSGLLAFASAFWQYMTPRGVNPSPHDVMIRRFVPNDADSKASITQGFGTTINILYGEAECGRGQGKETPEAARRATYYTLGLAKVGVQEPPFE